MLLVEAAALALLLARRRKAVEEALRAGQWPALRVFAALQSTIALTREAARSLAFARLQVQFPGLPLERSPFGPGVDRIRAGQIARRQVADLELRVARLELDRLSLERRWATALAKTEGRVASTAATETFSAASAERNLVTRQLGGGFQLLKVWDAQLDACPVCFRMDGTTVPVNEHFPGGLEPAMVHPWCRCWCTIIRGFPPRRTFPLEPRKAA